MVQDTINGKRFYGQYRGTVLRHLFNGKCKVFVPGVYDNQYAAQPEKLPDAEQASPIFAGGGYTGNGVFSYPNIGATVWVFFMNGDQNLPVYWAVSNSGQSCGAQYMDVANGLDPKAGENPSVVHKINCGHCQIMIYESGTVDVQVSNGKDGDEKAASKLFLKDDGTIEISSTKSIKIDAPSVKINGKEQLDIAAGSASITADRITVNAGQSMTLYTANFEKTVANPLGEIPGQ